MLCSRFLPALLLGLLVLCTLPHTAVAQTQAGAEYQLPPPSARPAARRTHPGVKAMRWGGLALAVSGMFVASASYGAYVGGELTHERYEQLRLVNDIGWGVWG